MGGRAPRALQLQGLRGGVSGSSPPSRTKYQWLNPENHAYNAHECIQIERREMEAKSPLLNLKNFVIGTIHYIKVRSVTGNSSWLIKFCCNTGVVC